MLESNWEYHDFSTWQMPKTVDVIIVEDDLTTSRLIKAIAERVESNMRIKSFTNAEGAIQYLAGIKEQLHKTPDLAIVDLYLSGPKNGLAVCEWLNRHSRETSVVLTSSILPDLFYKMTRSMTEPPLFLPKPFTIRQMAGIFEKL